MWFVGGGGVDASISLRIFGHSSNGCMLLAI